MSLVTAKEISKILKIHSLGYFGIFVGWLVLLISRISELNKVYTQHKSKSGLTFLNSILNAFEIQYDIPEEDLKRIPKTGAFITISNHPLGGIDGILLMKLGIAQRENYKILGNFFLHRIAPLQPHVFPVNPFENHKNVRSSVSGIKKAMAHLKAGFPLGVFPAGEVSTKKEGSIYVDKNWDLSAVKLIKNANVPVIPIYFHAKNSKLFYVISKFDSLFRTAKLPSELLTQKYRFIKIRIGNPISVKDQNEYDNLSQYSAFLRKKTYILANSFQKKPLILSSQNLKIPVKAKQIADKKNTISLIKEVSALRENGGRLLESKNYEVFFSKPKAIPNLLHEIGRLREITFRAVGEGTNKSIDLDKYDHYYSHLMLWDRTENILVGAYRMGFGKQIMKRFGIKGFYIHTLFRIDPDLYPMMENTIEMGRAFIVKDYQKKPMPLFLLWKGIINITLRYPDHKYLMGGVSISNRFSDFSKSLMIEFMKSHYYDPFVAQYIRPKKEFKVKLKDGDKDFVFDATKSDMRKFDKIIDEIEPGALRIPVLIKKYVKQNARLVAFNVDPKFNNAIDGLMYIKVADIPESTVKPVLEEFQNELENKALEELALK